MSLTNHVPERGRVYVRKFDHDEAHVRYVAGESITDLATEYGVTYNAVFAAVHPERKERTKVTHRAWRTTTCEDCGGPAMRLIGSKLANNPDGRILCSHCRGIARRSRFLFDDVGTLIAVRCQTSDCANGERWQLPERFPRGSRFKDVRNGGISGQCRACQTRERQRRRSARAVACDHCGGPCLHPNDRGGNGRQRLDRNLCKRCYQASRAREPEAMSTTKETGSSVA